MDTVERKIGRIHPGINRERQKDILKIVADSEIAQTIDVADTKEYRRQYDAIAKKLVSQKAILAYILKSTMKEFQDVSVRQIAGELIRGTPEVGTIAVHQDTPDAPPDRKEQDGQKRLSGSDRVPVASAEDTSIREGTVRYDIHFRVRVPGAETEQESVEIIMNVEVQNSDLPGYPIPKRAVYYVARLISAQRGEVFQDQEYEKIKKAVSIWICRNTARKRSDTINEYRLQKICRRGEYREEEKNYDLMRFFVLRLGDPGEESDEPAVRLLSVLLSTEMTAEEKKKILSEKFYIDMTEELDQEVSNMCNLSEGILEKGRAEGMEAGEAIGRMKTLFGLVKNGTLMIFAAAEAAAMDPSEFERQYNESLSQPQ